MLKGYVDNYLKSRGVHFFQEEAVQRQQGKYQRPVKYKHLNLVHKEQVDSNKFLENLENIEINEKNKNKVENENKMTLNDINALINKTPH